MSGRVAQLSRAALRLAAAGSWTDPADLAQWLYRFGTVPRDPAFERDFGPDDDPMAVLGLTVGGRARRRLEETYDATTYPGWYSFARVDGPEVVPAACKLYVSPRPDGLADAFPRIVDEFALHHVRSFKVGRGIRGLLRPDKIVAYFDDSRQLNEVADALRRSLRGCPAQGVPFTTEIDAAGLLSSGVDPPASSGATSWRAWITTVLATSLVAQRATSDADPIPEVLAEVRRAGVDTDRWVAGEGALANGASP